MSNGEDGSLPATTSKGVSATSYGKKKKGKVGTNKNVVKAQKNYYNASTEKKLEEDQLTLISLLHARECRGRMESVSRGLDETPLLKDSRADWVRTGEQCFSYGYSVKEAKRQLAKASEKGEVKEGSTRPQSPPCSTIWCASTRNLLDHIDQHYRNASVGGEESSDGGTGSGSEEKCDVQHCYEAQRLLGHYVECGSARCSLCGSDPIQKYRQKGTKSKLASYRNGMHQRMHAYHASLQQTMELLLHAVGCQRRRLKATTSLEWCHMRGCASMIAVVEHAATCRSKHGCRYPNCRTVKWLCKHWSTCGMCFCPICGPVASRYFFCNDAGRDGGSSGAGNSPSTSRPLTASIVQEQCQPDDSVTTDSWRRSLTISMRTHLICKMASAQMDRKTSPGPSSPQSATAIVESAKAHEMELMEASACIEDYYRSVAAAISHNSV